MKTVVSTLYSVLMVIALLFVEISPSYAADIRIQTHPIIPLPWLLIPPQVEPGQPMQLSTMEVRARIVGLQVEVSTDLTFFNPNNRILEGELQFPLPDGAVITGYALDINGQMVDGVIVKKEQARIAFETEVRRGVDPGIVEYVAGNLYKTRIYPLPAHGTRRVLVKYVAQLPVDNKGDAAWLCPMPIGAIVKDLNIRVEVAHGTVQPEIGGFGNLRFQTFANLWVAETKLQNAKPGEDIWVALPKLPAQITAAERVADGDVYFALSDLYTPTTPPTAPVTPPTEATEPIGIAWDASGSRNGEHLQQEIAALKKLGMPFALLVFRDKPEVIGSLTDPEVLKNIAYDGGTDLVAAATAISQSNIQRWLLFTDGFDTLADRLPDFGGKNVTAVVSQTTAHRELLRQVCGHVVDLQRLDATAIMTPPVRLLKVLGDGIAEVQGIGSSVAGRANIYGKLIADTAQIRLEYSDGHQSAPINISKQAATNGILVASVWAAQRVNQLAVRAEANEDELLAIGRRFGIVSPATSLIVLENLDQYVRHDIEPPASLPAMRQQWRDSKATTANVAKQQRISKIDQVLAMWKDRVDWWSSDYKVAKNIEDDVVPAAVPAPRFMQEEARQNAEYRLGAAPRLRRALAGDGGEGGSAAWGGTRGGSGGGGGAAAGYDGGRGGAGFLGDSAIDGDENLHARVVLDAAVNSSRSTVDTTVGTTATIAIKAWDPTTPYLTALKSATAANRYQVYLEQRKQFATSPAFFVDCAEFFLNHGDTLNGVRVLTNLAELKIEEASLLRVLAWRLQQAGDLDRAIVILRKVQKLRAEEPQSYRDLALALADQGKYTEAMELLIKVVMGEWQRFAEIELIALEELNAIIARHNLPVPASLDSRLVKNLDVDVRIVMVWDADNTDVDLHVVEPSKEEAYYSHNRTTMGGLVSRDFTGGYGPEEYMVRRAKPGPFKVFAHYYGSNQQTVIGPCTITATVFTNFGRPSQQQQVLTLRVDKPNDKADIGTIQFK